MRNTKVRSQFAKSMTLSEMGSDRATGLVPTGLVLGAPANSSGSISRSSALLATLISTKSTRLEIQPWVKDGHHQLANPTNNLSTMGSAMRSDLQSGKSLAPIANEHRGVELALNSELVDSPTVNLNIVSSAGNITTTNTTATQYSSDVTNLSALQAESVNRTITLHVGVP